MAPYNACVLGSINLAKVFNKGSVDWSLLEEVTETAVRFLDNIVTINEYPIPRIKEEHDKQRRIGLGITGLADILIKAGLSYRGESGRKFASSIMDFINDKSIEASEKLGLEKGSFPLFEESIYFGKYQAMRNAATTTIAPTGI